MKVTHIQKDDPTHMTNSTPERSTPTVAPPKLGSLTGDASSSPAPLRAPALSAPVGAPANFPPPVSAEDDLAYLTRITGQIMDAVSNKLVGQENLKQSLLIALFTNGHLLLESLPGLAKTTAAAAVAHAIDVDFKRIQCTPDLLPADIIGTQVYNSKTGEFSTQLGPVHTNVLLLDEINRSSAKTQSATLEAMQERQTTIGGVVHKLPYPFLVLATQNPIEQEGTYRLPEAQLDRFLMKDVLTYPSPDEELEILAKIESGNLDDSQIYTTDVTVEDVIRCQNIIKNIHVSDKLKQYIVHVVDATRNPLNVAQKYAEVIEEGASPRATIAFLKASKAVAALRGRDMVIPDDVQEVAHRVLRHRISLRYTARTHGIQVEEVIDAIIHSISIV